VKKKGLGSSYWGPEEGGSIKGVAPGLKEERRVPIECCNALSVDSVTESKSPRHRD